MSLSLKRRSFLQSAALGAVGLSLGFRARAQSTTNAPLFISVEASAAWDTTTTIDPHGVAEFSPYTEAQIYEALPGFRVAPFDGAAQRDYRVRRLRTGNTVDFWTTFAPFIRVVNGVDHRTVSHDIGPRHAFSGSLREGFPAIGALAARVQGPNRPLAFLSTGGFDDTQGIVTLTRSGRQNVLKELARPNSSNGGVITNTNAMLPSAAEQLVQQAQAARDARRGSLLAARGALKKARANHDALVAARGAEAGFLDLADILDANDATSDTNPIVSAASLVLAAMRTDPASCTSAHLASASFDTHSDHDDLVTGHRPRQKVLLEGIGHLIDEIENNPANQALKDRGVLIYVSSDFGRTAYNGGDDDGARGKDHWPVTSALFIGLGALRGSVGGGTVIGRTSPRIGGQVQPGVRAHPLRIDDNGNLQAAASPTANGDDLFALTATEVQYALRDALRLQDEAPAPGALKQIDRFALPEVDARFKALVDSGRNPILKDV